MEKNIEIKNLSKFYGRKEALKNVNLTIGSGMFGLLGRNGAGKTTLMKTISTLLYKQKGEITVCGIPTEKAEKVRSIIGYLPQDFDMYGNMNMIESLDYLGVLSGMPKEKRMKRISSVLEQVNLQDQKQKKVKALSGGMKRRLGIAQALLHEPKVLIVDEPTEGLDPEERVRFRNLLSEIAYDRIVILSTHIVGDVEAACEKIAILDMGEIIFNGSISELCDLAEGSVYKADVSQNDMSKIRAAYTVTSITPKGKRNIVRFLSGNRKPEFGISVEPNVEDAYMYCLSKTGKGVE